MCSGKIVEREKKHQEIKLISPAPEHQNHPFDLKATMEEDKLN